MTCLQDIDRPIRAARNLCASDVIDQAALLRMKAIDSSPRMELVARIRAEIASGQYDANGKLNVVLERMLDMM